MSDVGVDAQDRHNTALSAATDSMLLKR